MAKEGQRLYGMNAVLVLLLLSGGLGLGTMSIHDNEVFVEGAHSAGSEFPIHSFLMDKHLVTVEQFHEFVTQTGYVTDADRYGSGGVFDQELGTFIAVEGANYLFPFGPHKDQANYDHPVTQVSWNDAFAYATWKGKRLPTKIEWEFAATNRMQSTNRYSWGDALVEGGKFKANTWQGSFPFYNSKDDGYQFTSPVGVFGENALGLTDMGGNVWQWCLDDVDPAPNIKIFDPAPRKLLKGGSFLCDPFVCHGYKIKGESSSTPETSMGHIGFRCVRELR